jgi:hypothetical protein
MTGATPLPTPFKAAPFLQCYYHNHSKINLKRLLGSLPSGIDLQQLNLANPKQYLCVLEFALLRDPKRLSGQIFCPQNQRGVEENKGLGKGGGRGPFHAAAASSFFDLRGSCSDLPNQAITIRSGCALALVRLYLSSLQPVHLEGRSHDCSVSVAIGDWMGAKVWKLLAGLD